MTNYNERLDEILNSLANSVEWCVNPETLSGATVYREREADAINQAKQAITSLIKELVAEAKPADKDQLAQSTLDDESRCRFYRYGGYNFAIGEFEQNLLKALEEL